MEGLEYLEQRPGRCVATWQSVVLWFGPTPMGPDDPARLASALQGRLAQHPNGVAALRWVTAGASGPGEEAREQIIEVFDQLGERLRGFATVLEGSGFWAGGARSVLTDISRRTGYTSRLTVLGDVDEGARWVVDRLEGTVELADLRMAVARVRTRLAELGTVPR